MANPATVLVLLDPDGLPRGKTHALDCHMAPSFTWNQTEYVAVAATSVPDSVGRCGFCGGGERATIGEDASSLLRLNAMVARLERQ